MGKSLRALGVTLYLVLATTILIGAYIWYDPLENVNSVPNDEVILGGGKIVHLSIDDVESIFNLQYSEAYPKLFDHPFFSYLKTLHHKYGIKITLYTYALIREGKIVDIPLKNKEDFKENSDWLRIGFHWTQPEFNKSITVKDFENGYKNVEKAVYNFADSSVWSKTQRLHYFFGPDSLCNTLDNTNTLLCADDQYRKSYNLSALETTLAQE